MLILKYWKRNLVLINNATHQRETLSERPIRQPLNHQKITVTKTIKKKNENKRLFDNDRMNFSGEFEIKTYSIMTVWISVVSLKLRQIALIYCDLFYDFNVGKHSNQVRPNMN